MIKLRKGRRGHYDSYSVFVHVNYKPEYVNTFGNIFIFIPDQVVF